MAKIAKIITEFILVVAIGAGAYYYYTIYIVKGRPCDTVIPYTIGTFDAQFNINQKNFLTIVKQAADIWEKAAGKKLFTYVEDGSTDKSSSRDIMDIDLIYDYRQEAVDRLSKLGITIENTQASFASLKSRYDSLKFKYTEESSEITSETTALNRDMAAYNQEVTRWNGSGGVPNSRSRALEDEKLSLEKRITALNSLISSSNNDAATLNDLGTELNKLASTLNLNVKSYNAIGNSTGKEFDEGLYIQDAAGRHINIYAFEDNNELRRVLAHELGHALGMGHVNDPDSIMYRVNQSKNEVLTQDDLNELYAACFSKAN